MFYKFFTLIYSITFIIAQKAITVDDFLKNLSDDIVQKFYEIFEPLINLTIIEICKKMEKKFETEINKISLTKSGLQGDCAARDIVITQLRTENTALKSQLSDIVSKGNEMKQYSRMDNLVINGLKTSAADFAVADVVASSSTSLHK